MARLLERAAKNSPEAYPPLNIEEPADNILRITLAVAGFTPEQLSVSLSDRELTIKGERPQSPDGRVFLHKGIAARGFMRSFALAQGLEVHGANNDPCFDPSGQHDRGGSRDVQGPRCDGGAVV